MRPPRAPRTRLALPLAAALAWTLAAPPAAAQLTLPSDTLSGSVYGSSAGGALSLSNYGFGASGALRHPLSGAASLVVEFGLGAGKDEREQEFFTGPFGETVTPFKRHHFLMLPFTLGVEQRLWAEAIEDDFRPFFLIGSGPVLGYQWPYFEDENGNGIRDPGEPKRAALDLRGGSFRFGWGGTVGLGAYFGDGPGAVGLRIGYAAQYFTEPVELLEPRPEIERPERRFFGTPVVSFHVLRLR